MRKLLVLVIVAVGLWSGYWFIGSTAKERVLNGWLEERRAAGWTAEATAFDVVGYPNRFDSRFQGLELYDPRSGIGWSAPLFHILALSYQPNHVIAVWPGPQVLTFPGDTVAVDSTKLLASVVFEPDTKLAVARTSLETDDLTLKGGLGWKTGIKHLSLATRQTAAEAFAHDIVFDATGFSPTNALLNALDPSGGLPRIVDKLYLDLTLGFDAPWDRIAIEEGAPHVTSIKVNSIDTSWGALGLTGMGTLDVAPSGQISGEIGVELRNWQAVVDLFVMAGAISKDTAQTIKSGLGLFAGSGPEATLKTTLSLADGMMSLGPIPIGPAPRFVR
jgi:hypothetical protein